MQKNRKVGNGPVLDVNMLVSWVRTKTTGEKAKLMIVFTGDH